MILINDALAPCVIEELPGFNVVHELLYDTAMPLPATTQVIRDLFSYNSRLLQSDHNLG